MGVGQERPCGEQELLTTAPVQELVLLSPAGEQGADWLGALPEAVKRVCGKDTTQC